VPVRSDASVMPDVEQIVEQITTSTKKTAKKQSTSIGGETIGLQFFNAIPYDLRNREMTSAQQAELLDRFKDVTDITSAIQLFWQFMKSKHIILTKSAIVRLDNERYHQLWYCPKCKHRWGRHGSSGECPKGKFDLSEDDN